MDVETKNPRVMIAELTVRKVKVNLAADAETKKPTNLLRSKSEMSDDQSCQVTKSVRLTLAL